MSAAIVVEERLARAAGVSGSPALHAVPREERRGRPRPLDPDQALAALLATPRALVLARPWPADPGAGCLAALASAVGLEVLALHGDLDAAAWTLGHATLWATTGTAHLERAVAVACALPGAGEMGLPRRPLDDGAIGVPAVRPAVLARWAGRAWRPCGWCLAGGGLPGARCPRCGAAVLARRAPPARPGPMAEVVPLARARRAA